MKTTIIIKRAGGWEEAPDDYIYRYRFDGLMLELEGREVVVKIEDDGKTLFLCGTPELVAATKVKHPRGKMIMSFSEAAKIIEEKKPEISNEYFPDAWESAFKIIGGTNVQETHV